MAKVDRLVWAAGTCFVAYGVRVGIRVNRPEALDRLSAHLPPGWRPSASPVVDQLYSLFIGDRPRTNIRRYHLLYSGLRRAARTTDLDLAFEALESELRLGVASAARRRVFVHAGVVAWRERAIVLPGRSCSGKTTLVAELLRAGATYYSDEFAVLDARGRVHPFPKPLSIREASDGIRRCDAESLGSSRGVEPLPLGLVALTQYRPGARWRPARLTPGQGLLALLGHTVPVRRRPESALATLERVVSQAVVLRGARGEAEGVASSLLERLEEWMTAPAAAKAAGTA